MDVSTWTIISIAGFSLSGILLIIAIVIFFKLNISSIINDLSGRTARKQIQQIQQGNISINNKHAKASVFDINNREAIDIKKIGKAESGELKYQGGFFSQNLSFKKTNITEKISGFNSTKTEKLIYDNSQQPTEVLCTDDTNNCNIGSEPTTILSQNANFALNTSQNNRVNFIIEKNIIGIHTNEVI